MNGFVLLIPFLLVRFGLLSFLNEDAVKRAAFFAPVIGREVPAYWLYQISNVFIISSHWIILSEERWCIKEFGDEYRKYMERVGRYLWMI